MSWTRIVATKHKIATTTVQIKTNLRKITAVMVMG